MKEVVIFGTGGHAKVVYDILIKQNIYKPVAFFSLNENLESFNDTPHYHQSKFAEMRFDTGIVAIGDNSVRSEVVEFILQNKSEFSFISAVHPSAHLGQGVSIGNGSAVMAGVVVNSSTSIGPHVILNTGSIIDHDCKIDDYASIAPGCTLGGNVKVGQYSAISLGANIIHGQSIGAHTVVGAGSLVLKNVGDFQLAYGVPCTEIKKRTSGEKYL